MTMINASKISTAVISISHPLIPCCRSFVSQATLVESALSSIEESATVAGEAGGHAVDYTTLPNAIVPVMANLFKAPLTPEEEYYALEVGGCGPFSLTCVCKTIFFFCFWYTTSLVLSLLHRTPPVTLPCPTEHGMAWHGLDELSGRMAFVLCMIL